MSGAKARHFLQKPPSKSGKTSMGQGLWELWKDLCRCTTDNDSNPEFVNQRKQVWDSFDKMVKLMMLTSTVEEQRRSFQNQLIQFTTAVTNA